MAVSPKKAAAKETHQSIARQTAEFLKSGKKIQRIPSGVSGQPLGTKAKIGAKAKSGTKAK